jgi:uncharacterized coiled-coil protein SlyX
MDSNNAAIIIAVLSAITTIIGGSYATWQQLKRDSTAAVIETDRLQDEIEERLWKRVKTEFDAMTKRIDDQSSTIEQQAQTIKEQSNTITEQGALIMQLRAKLEVQDTRIKTLEKDRDDWKARALRAEGGSKKRV